VDSCRYALDYGCIDQYIDGAVPCICWRYASQRSAHTGICHAEFLYTKEYSPEELAAFEAHKLKNNEDQVVYNDKPVENHRFIKTGSIFGLIGIVINLVTYYFELEQELYVMGSILTLFGILMYFSVLLKNNGKTENVLIEVFSDLLRMPDTMKQLAVVQFFTWVGLFAMWIYTTSGVTSHILGTTDTQSAVYNEGADWIGVLFGVYSGVAALVAFALPVLAKYTSRKFTHAICLILGGIGLASIYLFPTIELLWIPMIGIGIAWASILSMPYAILTGALPAHKMGVYMGIFNFFIVLPQILAATILGFLVKDVFGNQPIYALVFGGVSMLIAAFTVLFVEDRAAPEKL